MAGNRINVGDQFRSQSGFGQYRDLVRNTAFKDYPWGMVAANVLGIAASFGLSHKGAKTLSRALMKTPLRRRLARMPEPSRTKLLANIGGLAGTGAVITADLATLAGQARVAERLAQLEKQKRAQGHEKAAHVYEIYRLAIEKYPDE